MSDRLSFAPVPTRRIVTGHDNCGKPITLFDGPATNSRNGGSAIVSTLLWSTDSMPVDISVGPDAEDMGDRVLGIQPPPRGTRFVVNDIAPGATPMHRTDTIDYVIVLAGQIDLDLPSQTISLHTGDVVIQRGNDHAWVNRTEHVARIAVVLIDAAPVEIQ